MALGYFEKSDGTKAFGKLKINGKHTRLSLFSSNPLIGKPEDSALIYGVLNDLTQVSLIDCIQQKVGTKHSRHSGADLTVEYQDVFPHCIALGQRRFNPKVEKIHRILLRTDQLSKILIDKDITGSAFSISENVAGQIIRNHFASAQINVASIKNPTIYYDSGLDSISLVQTGKLRLSISIWRRAQKVSGFLGPKLEPWLIVEPSEPLTLSEAKSALLKIMLFLDLVSNSQNKVKAIKIDVDRSDPVNGMLDLVFSYRFLGSPKQRRRNAFLDEMPINYSTENADFERVFVNWSRFHSERESSRLRIASSLRSNLFSINRLIASANAFDLLPNNCKPPPLARDPEIDRVVRDFRKQLRNLPVGVLRNV
jgi:hypothetical protein